MPTVAEQVRIALQECRAAGMSFDDAWAATVGRARSMTRERRLEGGSVLYPHDTFERRAWKQALAATRAEWRAGYEVAPSMLSRRLGERVEALAAADDGSRPARTAELADTVGGELVAA